MSGTTSSDSPPALTIYFGYGSNMWLDQMKRRCAGSRFIGIGYLDHWKWFINTRGYANVKKSDGDKVWGSMYELTQSDEDSLDGYEGVPTSYIKETLQIAYLGQEEHGALVDGRRNIEALVYVDVKRLEDGPPTPSYIPRMNAAIHDGIEAGIPKAYMDKYLRPFIPLDDPIPN